MMIGETKLETTRSKVEEKIMQNVLKGFAAER
jgi:hypothetical protein